MDTVDVYVQCKVPPFYTFASYARLRLSIHIRQCHTFAITCIVQALHYKIVPGLDHVSKEHESGLFLLVYQLYILTC